MNVFVYVDTVFVVLKEFSGKMHGVEGGATFGRTGMPPVKELPSREDCDGVAELKTSEGNDDVLCAAETVNANFKNGDDGDNCKNTDDNDNGDCNDGDICKNSDDNDDDSSDDNDDGVNDDGDDSLTYEHN